MTGQHRATNEQWATAEKWAAGDGFGVMHACLLELRDRIQQLEATQHALLRCKADGLEPTEAGVRYAMQMRFPGSWQPIGGTTTYSESCNEVAAASPEVRQPPPPPTDRILALQDQIRDGALTLADALKEINSEPEPADDARQLTLVERVADAIGTADDEGLTNMTWSHHAHAAIREVAAAALQMHPDPNLTWERVALWLEQEANR